jgi:predicted outer membrane lipoprotein
MATTGSLIDRVGILRPLRLRDFRLLWLGMTVSFIGDGVYIVAVAWQVYREFDASPAAFAAVGIAWALPQVLLLLATGALSDRMDRRWLMIGGDLIRLVAIGAVGVLSITGILTVPILVGLVAVYGAGQALFGPAFSSIVPQIVPQEHLVEANSLGQVVRPLALTVLGPLLGGVLVIFGAGWAFLVDSATFAVSAACVWMMRTRPVPHTEGEREPPITAQIVEGIRYVRSERWIAVGLFGALVSLFCVWGPWETLLPFVIERQLDGSGLDLALVFGASGLGSIAVGLTMAQRGGLPRRPLMLMYLAWALGMLMTAGFGIVTAVWQAMAVAFVAEGAISLLVVLWFTILQRLVPSNLLGRVTSLDWMITIAGAPVSFAVVGPLAGLIGVDTTLIVSGIAGGLITLACMFIPGALGPDRDGSLRDEPASTLEPDLPRPPA